MGSLDSLIDSIFEVMRKLLENNESPPWVGHPASMPAEAGRTINDLLLDDCLIPVCGKLPIVDQLSGASLTCIQSLPKVRHQTDDYVKDSAWYFQLATQRRNRRY